MAREVIVFAHKRWWFCDRHDIFWWGYPNGCWLGVCHGEWKTPNWRGSWDGRFSDGKAELRSSPA